jgi:hypothetical protein
VASQNIDEIARLETILCATSRCPKPKFVKTVKIAMAELAAAATPSSSA